MGLFLLCFTPVLAQSTGTDDGSEPKASKPSAATPAPALIASTTRADIARAYLAVDRAFSAYLLFARESPDDAKLREFNRAMDHVTNLFFQSRMPEALKELVALRAAIESAVRHLSAEARDFTDDDPVASSKVECLGADAEREELLKRLNAIVPVSEAHRTIIEIVKARAALVTTRPDLSNSESFLLRWDCEWLGQRVRRTVDGLEKGMLFGYTSPQHYWPLIIPDGPPIPMRKPELNREKLPDAARDAEISNSGRPVIIALHGAGGDETIFQFAYGNGMLLREADDRDAIVVLPRTEFFGFYPDALPRLLDQLEMFQKIDRSRVYLIGHSLGAQAALGLARKHPDLVRAVVFIAGGVGIAPSGEVNPKDLPPVLMVGGEFDRIFTASRLEQEATRAKAAGLDVELRIKPNYGHVFVVNGSLREAIQWFETQGLPKPR